jgi:hypothetical protein
MGLLDEAIREHLELKRRRGADPTEVERLEREALGPVRRMQPEITADEPPELAVQAVDQGLVADEPEDLTELMPQDGYAPQPENGYAPADEDYGPEEPGGLVEQQPNSAPEPAEPSPAPAPAPPGVASTPEPVHAGEAPPPSAPSDRPVHEDPGVETAEYDVEAEHAAEEDVLEETPEFLQDTPDHDRLWFEQRPPKDFDFDG